MSLTAVRWIAWAGRWAATLVLAWLVWRGSWRAAGAFIVLQAIANEAAAFLFQRTAQRVETLEDQVRLLRSGHEYIARRIIHGARDA